MIFSAGISIALFISALLLVKQDKSLPDWILFFWMLINAAYIASFYFIESEKLFEYPFLLGLQFPIPLLQGVMLYFYVSTVTNQRSKSRYLDFLHFVPSLFTLIYMLPFLFSSSEHKINVFKNGGEGYETFMTILVSSVFVSGVAYVVWSILMLSRHKKRIRNQFSGLENINLRWLELLTYGLAIVWAIVIFTQNDTIIVIGVSVFVILIGFFGLRQKEIFKSKMDLAIAPVMVVQTTTVGSQAESAQPREAAKVIEPKEKYSSSGLTSEMSEKLHSKLTLLMDEEKVYKNSDLSLADLAQSLGTHPNYLSQILNEKEQVSFYDFINTYRIEEFKRLVSIPANNKLTLLAVAYDCGFNSKSSFNRYFKKTTNTTPSQFVKSLQGKA